MALEDASGVDPCAGWVVGANEIVCRFSSTLYLALRGERFVVLKRLPVEPAGLHDLQLHAEATAQVSHPNLAQVFAVEAAEEGTFWVTELFGGATLTELRAACKKAGKSLPLGLVFATFHEVALALGELHGRRRAHGDVSEDNILIGFGGTSKVLNPGLADCLQRLPPDPQTDVFALAGLLYECLTGARPGGPAITPPSAFNHALEKPMDELLLRALGPIRSKRFKTATDFAAALKTAASGYLWKPGQRAEFVFGLFKKRRDKEQELLATAGKRLAELRAERAAAKAAAEAAAEAAAFIAQQELALEQEPAIVSGELLDDGPQGPHVPTEPREVLSIPMRALKIGLSATAGIIACVFLVHALAVSPAPAAVASMAPPIPVLVPVAMVQPEPAAPPAAALPPAETQVASADDEPAPPEAAPAPAKVKKKLKKGGAADAPLPPWLMRKGRR